ncbi:MAG: CvpA family protein, partial [Eubacteriales bacterium]|nr:CvpA family protein [Eubacteriales bacterium]
GTDRELFWGSNGEADARRIQSLKLPEIIENLLISNRTAENYKKLAVDTLQGYVTAYMTRLIVNILTFLITWILVMAAVWVAGRLLNQIAELPGIRVLNRILGVMLGAVQGLIWVWMAFLLITIAANTEAGEAMLEMISENAFLRMLYNQNIILNVIQNIMNW